MARLKTSFVYGYAVHSGLWFGLTSLASLPPGVMLLNRRTAMRDSTTDIEKTYQKGAPSESDLIEA